MGAAETSNRAAYCARSYCGLWIALVRAFAKQLRKVTVRFVMSVHQSSWNNQIPSGRIWPKIDNRDYSLNLATYSSFVSIRTKVSNTLHLSLRTLWLLWWLLTGTVALNTGVTCVLSLLWFPWLPVTIGITLGGGTRGSNALQYIYT